MRALSQHLALQILSCSHDHYCSMNGELATQAKDQVRLTEVRLSQAVEQEQYGEAARLRDHIQSMQLRARTLDVQLNEVARSNIKYRVGECSA